MCLHYICSPEIEIYRCHTAVLHPCLPITDTSLQRLIFSDPKVAKKWKKISLYLHFNKQVFNKCCNLKGGFRWIKPAVLREDE